MSLLTRDWNEGNEYQAYVKDNLRGLLFEKEGPCFPSD